MLHRRHPYTSRAIPCGWIVLILLASCRWEGDRRPEPEPSAARVFVIGWDGADWKVIEPLVEKGELPNIAGLIGKGAHGELETIWPTLSPVIWTSIATGTAPEKHGILGFWRESRAEETPSAPGEAAQIEHLKELGYIESPPAGAPSMVMYRATDRRSPALWNLLGEQGLATTVVSWWVTHPAESILGHLISDRYFFSRFELVAEELGVAHETSERLVYPAELDERLRPLVLRGEDLGSKDLEPFIEGEIHLSSETVLYSGEDELRMILAKDESAVRVTELLLKASIPSLLMVYIQGTDIVCHYFWKYRFTEEWNWIFPEEAVSEADVERYGRTIESYYKLQDRRLGEILRYADNETAIIFCSDHGFTTGRRGHASSVSGIHWMSASPGVLILAGAGIRSGVTLDSAHVFDIAPTVLALLGLPPEPSMDGRVLTEALNK